MLARQAKFNDIAVNRFFSNRFFGLKLLEWLLCGIIISGCAVLHLTQYYYPLALPIEAGLSLISFATPISGMLYLSAAQVIPDAPQCPLSSAQMALLGFFMWQLATMKVMNIFRDGRPLLIAVAPFLVWNSGLALMRGDNGYLFFTLTFAILTGCAAAVLVQQSGYRLQPCLAAFLAGQALAMCLFWILKLNLGVPIQAFDTELYGDSTLEAVRIGTARGNANMLGPPMAFVCIGAIGYFVSRPKLNWLSGLILLGCLAAAAPPLIGSGSRGAIVSVAWGVGVLVVVRLLAGKSFASAPLATVCIVAVLAFGWEKWGLNDRWEEMENRQSEQEEDQGSALGGRTLEWEAAWEATMKSPIIGGGEVNRLSYLYNPEMWASHSTYLDAGLVGGIPGMALFGWLVLKPILELWRRKHEPDIALLLAVYIVCIISIGSTSAMQLKHFWMLWGIAAACFLPAVTRGKMRSAQNGGLTSKNLRPEEAQAELDKLHS